MFFSCILTNEASSVFQDFKAKTASRFVVDIEDDIVDVAEEDESGESHDVYDDVCAFCDEGGDLLWYAHFAG